MGLRSYVETENAVLGPAPDREPIQIIQLPALQHLEATPAANSDPEREVFFSDPHTAKESRSPLSTIIMIIIIMIHITVTTRLLSLPRRLSGPEKPYSSRLPAQPPWMD